MLVAGIACTPATMDSTPSVVATDPQTPCAPPEAVSFDWLVEPGLEDISLDATCTIDDVGVSGDALLVALACAEPVGARTLWLSAEPAPPRAALEAASAAEVAVHLHIVVAPPVDGAASYLRLATDAGELLVAGAAGGVLDPAEFTELWQPFTIVATSSTCASQSEVCGEVQRVAVQVQRSGGEPQVIHDAGSELHGEIGEARVWVAEARAGAATCVGDSGAWYRVGVMARF